MIYRDRTEAGNYLAAQLDHYADRDDVLVLALPRGGVPVAFEVAKALRAPLDIFLVRKSVSQVMRNWPWVPLQQVACVFLMMM